MSAKVELRGRLQAVASTVNPTARREQSAVLCEALMRLPWVAHARSIALFIGVAHEPDTRSLFARLTGKQRWLPKVTGPASLGWAAVESLEQLKVSRYGLLEPANAEHARLPPVDAVIVPGLGFDRHGGRIGRGAGYYDRALSAGRGFRTIGVCLEAFLVEHSIPMDVHDVQMNAVVTPSTILYPASQAGAGEK